MDRIDISVITQMLDEYWKRRNYAAIKLEERETLDSLGSSSRLLDNIHPLDGKLNESVDRLSGTFGNLKDKMMEWRQENKIESKQ